MGCDDSICNTLFFFDNFHWLLPVSDLEPQRLVTFFQPLPATKSNVANLISPFFLGGGGASDFTNAFTIMWLKSFDIAELIKIPE